MIDNFVNLHAEVNTYSQNLQLMFRREIAPNIMETVIENPSDKLLAICRKMRYRKMERKEEILKKTKGITSRIKI